MWRPLCCIVNSPGCGISPLFPLSSKCANHLYICIFQFAKREKTLCLSLFEPFSVYTNIQFQSVFRKKNLYICIKDVKSHFTLFNAKQRPLRPFTVGRGGYKPLYSSFCMCSVTLKSPVYRHFRGLVIVKYRIYRKNS